MAAQGPASSRVAHPFARLATRSSCSSPSRAELRRLQRHGRTLESSNRLQRIILVVNRLEHRRRLNLDRDVALVVRPLLQKQEEPIERGLRHASALVDGHPNFVSFTAYRSHYRSPPLPRAQGRGDSDYSSFSQ